MTPTESREVVLGLSRERLARATARLERVARDAVERIHHFKHEKQALERRLADLETLFTQERQNFEQRAALLSSMTSETTERSKAFEDLTARLNEQERLVSEQMETIAALNSELAQQTEKLREQESQGAGSRNEITEWRTKAEELERRLQKATGEREALKSKLYEDERQAAQFVLHLTADDRDRAAKAIDSLIDQLSAIENRTFALEEK